MNVIPDIAIRNAVLKEMAKRVGSDTAGLLAANREDLEHYANGDLALYDRLKLDEGKIAGMVQSLEILARQEDPLGVERYRFTHENGLEIINRTAAFGTVLIIYESRPDVTVEAAGIAFKSGNRILLKGGREAQLSNLALTRHWQQALQASGLPEDWVTYLEFSRKETQEFLQQPSQKIDLIVPRGGEKLIAFVKEHARCPVIVSGRGNNFLLVDKEADPDMAMEIILNAKTSKISACNALDKVLIHRDLPAADQFVARLTERLLTSKVSILADEPYAALTGVMKLEDPGVWFEEFLDYRIVLGSVKSLEEAIGVINTYSGGHSASIISRDARRAEAFMERVDAAAVYHNASTRFTDGGQFGLGGELAISTDKLHQRGPLGLAHLTTNKWYVMGNGQVRK